MRPLAFLLLCLLACPLSQAETTPPPSGDGIQLVPKKKSKTADRCKEEIQYFHLTGLKDPQRLKKINALIRSSVAITEGCRANGPDPEFSQPYAFENQMKDVRKLGSVVVFRVQETTYTGGVHSNYVYQTHVIDLRDAREVDLDPLFKTQGHEAMLELGKSKLRQYYMRTRGTGEVQLPPRTLAIRSHQILPQGDGFQVQFDPYEVDSFAAGAPIISYSAEEASKIFVSEPLTRTLFGAK